MGPLCVPAMPPGVRCPPPPPSSPRPPKPRAPVSLRPCSCWPPPTTANSTSGAARGARNSFSKKFSISIRFVPKAVAEDPAVEVHSAAEPLAVRDAAPSRPVLKRPDMTRLVVKGAREHNLRNVDLDLPRDAMIVFTGLSGSGKSSLAFDTIFAEGQRRYVESLSAYARQFLGQVDKPDVDFIEGLSPAVSIDQKSTNRNPRSTVGTITEIHDYMRLLWARIGVPHCPQCGEVIQRQTVQQIADQLMELPDKTRYQIVAPVVTQKKGEFVDLFKELGAKGYSRARVDGELVHLSDPPKLGKQFKHTIEVVVDRLVVKEDISQRLTDSVETALGLSEGRV